MNTTYDPRQDDPMHDDYNMTQEQFEEAAAAMNFPTITIPDPAAVGKWLDEQQPDSIGKHTPAFGATGWTCLHFERGVNVFGKGDTPEALLENIRAELAANDPLAKLRKEAKAMGYGLLKLPQD